MNVEEKETLRRAYDLKGKREFLQFSPVTQSKSMAAGRH